MPKTIQERLPAVDGLRAVAAMWVVLFHIHAFSEARFPQIPGLDLVLRSGSTGVSLFLVLSGFCLYLPFAAGRQERFKVGQFFIRRCRRLLPAYYTSLVLAVVLAIGAPGWLGIPPLNWPEALWQLATHVSLTHSLFPSTFYNLNGAYWSLGLEWQLYLGLPLLILAIRRFGIAWTALIVVLCNVVYRLALGAALDAQVIDSTSLLGGSVLPNQLPGRWAEFALGMVAAELHASGRLESWRLTPMLIAIPVFVAASLLVAGSHLSHLLYGAVFFTLLCVVLASDNAITRAMSWRPVVAIGTMSYSLYLVHQPLVQGLAHFIKMSAPGLPSTAVFGLLMLLLPVVVLLSWVLFVTVERRTLTSNRAPSRSSQPKNAQSGEGDKTPRAEQTAVVQTAAVRLVRSST